MNLHSADNVSTKAKPFLKWAGGKGQLLSQIKAYLPEDLRTGKLCKYAEPFIGGGAVFFFMAEHFPMREFFLSDMNQDLALAYKILQTDVETLIELLHNIQDEYFQMSSAQQKLYFYNLRTAFNRSRSQASLSALDHHATLRVAHLVFLNRTCFNGLYRVNLKGEFNVPFGSYNNPGICDADNLRNTSKILENAKIHAGDFTDCEHFLDPQTFIYFDPPYRPISKTASFNSYSKNRFDDDQQIRLANFCKQVDQLGAKLMVSNSDPHNEDPQDDFFQKIYAGFTIRKVTAKRAINSNGSKRGEITELLIMNY